MDLVVPLISGAFFALLYKYPLSTPDEGLLLVPAERILRGQIPYRDFFSEIAPGSFYIQAAIFRLAGSELAVVRMTVLLLGVLLTWLLYRLSRKLLPGAVALMPPLIMAGICYACNYILSHHWWGILFLILMVLCLANWAEDPIHQQTVPILRLWLAGGLGAASLLCMQSEGALAIASGAGWLLLVEWLPVEASWRNALLRGLISFLWFLSGAVSVMGLAMGYFWVHGGLAAWVFDNFTFLFTNYLPYEGWAGIYSWLRFKINFNQLLLDPSLHTVFHFAGFYFFAVVGPAIGFGGALWQIWWERKRELSRSRLLLLYLIAGFGALVSELHDPDILHLIWGSILLLMLFVNSWYYAYMSLVRWRQFLIAAACLTLVLVVGGALRRATNRQNWSSAVRTRRGTIYTDQEGAAIYQGWIDVIERNVPAGDETFTYAYQAQFYYLTDTRNPTHYDTLLADFHSPGEFNQALAELWRNKPKYIFDCNPLEHYPDYGGFRGESKVGQPDPLEKMLQSGQTPYELFAKIPEMDVWALKK